MMKIDFDWLITFEQTEKDQDPGEKIAPDQIAKNISGLVHRIFSA